MTMRIVVKLCAVAAVFGTLVSTTSASAQTDAAVVIRELLLPDATASKRFGSIFDLRHLANGGVLVNDGTRRQLTVLDAKLANPTILLDSIAEGAQSYGPRAQPLIPYLADSTFFGDDGSRTLGLIGPTGKFVRVVSPPKAADFIWMVRGTTSTDIHGNLIYRGRYPSDIKVVNGIVQTPEYPDSAPLVRGNFEKRSVDTVGAVKVQPAAGVTYRMEEGKRVAFITVKPLYTIDEWSMLSDGSIAMVRGHDYHVDVISPDGTKLSGPKLPFDFRRLTDDDKQKLLDSAKAAESERRAQVAASLRTRPAGGIGREGAEGPPAVSVPPLTEFLPMKEIADYYPPIRTGAAKPDADGNLWILPTTSARSLNGELVYDVVNNRGAMIERVRLPVGRSIAGFGRGGIVYLMSRDSEKTWMLERTRIARTK